MVGVSNGVAVGVGTGVTVGIGTGFAVAAGPPLTAPTVGVVVAAVALGEASGTVVALVAVPATIPGAAALIVGLPRPAAAREPTTCRIRRTPLVTPSASTNGRVTAANTHTRRRWRGARVSPQWVAMKRHGPRATPPAPAGTPAGTRAGATGTSAVSWRVVPARGASGRLAWAAAEAARELQITEVPRIWLQLVAQRRASMQESDQEALVHDQPPGNTTR
jgi:hypothetical protein